MTDYVQIFTQHQLPELPDASTVLDMRWIAANGDWWAQTKNGWFYLRGDTKTAWKPAPMGPPGWHPSTKQLKNSCTQDRCG